MSPEAIKQLYSPDADADLITLLTVYAEDGTTVAARLSDNYTQRLSETDDDIVYGVVSRGDDFMYLPFQIVLPSEEEANAPRCSITMFDVTRHLIPIIRGVSGPLAVKLELVLNKTPDVVEIEYIDFEIRNFTYNRDQVTCELSLIAYDREPFPMYSYTPQFNPGLF
jgi:hypothetical protein